ncbi:electron transport complex subunit RsxA [Buchnera aphidicola]|uniref:Ion-translocating oxidoreductase complex subunit A n=1 Tax=Buchnera aphidicola str. USDA (Myzus persicae) TaxID=1009856 RepID=W0P491_BUCMP|nr:electron transport complex subunit RsxA [Buchnera aphidicola]AHG60257.1 Rnfa [Buchnera aphidicola str. USDA (Myzus persicae)]AHG60835.1 Rnfa [Buchnera aphidicola str. W106 (Myzus persicae)]AHG61407.1 Rnfa [Buchnera aphidicola str. G002 (Myzus persicae)]AHG61980.1 Rnfa [Buchnera aphidicola str. F009 (Myzus persicae)]WAI03056.1 MAG: electron transport complex subunit RsxA [Buchnera aphidicola (Myzus persicae)]
MQHYFLFFVSNILIENFILVKFLGLCPFLGASSKIETSIGMSFATTFVILLSTVLLWLVNFFILLPLDLVYLRIIAYMLIISVSVQFLEIVLSSTSPILYRLLGIFLPLITTNCTVLAIPLFSLYANHTFLDSVLYGISASFGFTLVMIIFSCIRERIVLSDVPLPFQGAPVILITASIMSIAFMGFQGLVKF